MRYLLIIFCILPYFSFSQFIFPPEEFTRDSITVPTSYIVNAAEKIQNQKDSIEYLQSLVDELSKQTELQSVVLNQTEQELTLMQSRVKISDGIIDRYSDHVYNRRDKWYDRPIIHFAAGLATAYVSSVIYQNIK